MHCNPICQAFNWIVFISFIIVSTSDTVLLINPLFIQLVADLLNIAPT